jgi:hypothetical protein
LAISILRDVNTKDGGEDPSPPRLAVLIVAPPRAVKSEVPGRSGLPAAKALAGEPADLGYISPHGIDETLIMESILHGATFVALAAVVIVLLLGIVNMMRGTSPNRSQTLMRWRVILQFVAIVIMMTALYFASRG